MKKCEYGRPHTLHATDCLGLVLAGMKTRDSLMALQLIFVMTCSPVCKYLKFAHRIIIKMLNDDK